MSWRCNICGIEHDELPTCFGGEAPWPALVPASEFENRVLLTKDQCTVDDNAFFIRGHIEIPTLDSADFLLWSVWCSLSEQSHVHISENWENPGRAGSSYFGWLSTPIPVYPSTIGLKTIVLSRELGRVPLVHVQECDHPLFVEQKNGITKERYTEIVHEVLQHGAV
jgi:hypothetical protein